MQIMSVTKKWALVLLLIVLSMLCACQREGEHLGASSAEPSFYDEESGLLFTATADGEGYSVRWQGFCERATRS